jgi:hypothetical protein
VVKVGEGWVEQKLQSFMAGLPNELNILQGQSTLSWPVWCIEKSFEKEAKPTLKT